MQQNILESLSGRVLPTLRVIQPPNVQVYIDSMLRRRELDEDTKVSEFFGFFITGGLVFYWVAALEMVVKGFNDIVGVHWFQDDSGVLYSHQEMFLD